MKITFLPPVIASETKQIWRDQTRKTACEDVHCYPTFVTSPYVYCHEFLTQFTVAPEWKLRRRRKTKNPFPIFIGTGCFHWHSNEGAVAVLWQKWSRVLCTLVPCQKVE